jgi:hypothetical protein
MNFSGIPYLRQLIRIGLNILVYHKQRHVTPNSANIYTASSDHTKNRPVIRNSMPRHRTGVLFWVPGRPWTSTCVAQFGKGRHKVSCQLKSGEPACALIPQGPESVFLTVGFTQNHIDLHGNVLWRQKGRWELPPRWNSPRRLAPDRDDRLVGEQEVRSWTRPPDS